MKYILDCETQKSTLISLANVTGISTDSIWNDFLDLDHASIYESGNYPYDFSQYLYNSFIVYFNISKIKIDKICWFHLSRTLHPEQYLKHGILPRKEAFSLLYGTDKICHSFKGLVEWDVTQGPFAMLIREIAFCPDSAGNHDYLKIPELIEDIGLSEIYKEQGKSVIIKFIYGIQYEPDHYIKPILNYLFNCHNKNELTTHSNTCFNGEGKYIPKENIISIEFVDK